MHVKLPLLIVNHYLYRLLTYVVLLLWPVGSVGEARLIDSAFPIPPTTGQKLPEMPAHLQACF